MQFAIRPGWDYWPGFFLLEAASYRHEGGADNEEADNDVNDYLLSHDSMLSDINGKTPAPNRWSGRLAGVGE